MQGGRSTRWQDGTSRLPVAGCPETASADPTDEVDPTDDQEDAIRCQLALRRSSASTSARPAPRACWSPWTEPRSEEHTSELQSRGHLVCRLLLEQKKKNRQQRANAIRRRKS